MFVVAILCACVKGLFYVDLRSLVLLGAVGIANHA